MSALASEQQLASDKAPCTSAGDESARSAPELSVIMPVYNEEQALPGVLEEARHALAGAPFGFEIVLVDDASTDSSLAILLAFQERHPQFPMRVLRHERNRGIAAACATLFTAARGATYFSMPAMGSVGQPSACG